MAVKDNDAPRNWDDLLDDFNFMCEEVLYAELKSCHKHYFRVPTPTETKIPPDMPLPIFRNNSKTSYLLENLLTKKLRVDSPFTGIFRMDIEETFMSKLKLKMDLSKKSYFTEAFFDKCEDTFTFVRTCVPNVRCFVHARYHIIQYFLHFYRRLTYIKVFAEKYMYMMNNPINPAYFLREMFPTDFGHLKSEMKAIQKIILKIHQQSNESVPQKLKHLMEAEIFFINILQTLILKMVHAFVERKTSESLGCQEFICQHFSSDTYRSLVRNLGDCFEGYENEFAYLSAISNQIDLVTLLLYSSLDEECIHIKKPTCEIIDVTIK